MRAGQARRFRGVPCRERAFLPSPAGGVRRRLSIAVRAFPTEIHSPPVPARPLLIEEAYSGSAQPVLSHHKRSRWCR